MPENQDMRNFRATFESPNAAPSSNPHSTLFAPVRQERNIGATSAPDSDDNGFSVGYSTAVPAEPWAERGAEPTVPNVNFDSRRQEIPFGWGLREQQAAARRAEVETPGLDTCIHGSLTHSGERTAADRRGEAAALNINLTDSSSPGNSQRPSIPETREERVARQNRLDYSGYLFANSSSSPRQLRNGSEWPLPAEPSAQTETLYAPVRPATFEYSRAEQGTPVGSNFPRPPPAQRRRYDPPELRSRSAAGPPTGSRSASVNGFESRDVISRLMSSRRTLGRSRPEPSLQARQLQHTVYGAQSNHSRQLDTQRALLLFRQVQTEQRHAANTDENRAIIESMRHRLLPPPRIEQQLQQHAGETYLESMSRLLAERVASWAPGLDETPRYTKQQRHEAISTTLKGFSTPLTALPSAATAGDHAASDECCVCTEDLTSDAAPAAITLNSCDHSFHESCIIAWFDETAQNQRLVTCPLCRCNVFATAHFRAAPGVEQPGQGAHQTVARSNIGGMETGLGETVLNEGALGQFRRAVAMGMRFEQLDSEDYVDSDDLDDVSDDGSGLSDVADDDDLPQVPAATTGIRRS